MRFPKLLLSACLCALLLVGVFGFVKAPVAHASGPSCVDSNYNVDASAEIDDIVTGTKLGWSVLCESFDGESTIRMFAETITDPTATTTLISADFLHVGATPEQVASNSSTSGANEIHTSTQFGFLNETYKAVGVITLPDGKTGTATATLICCP